MKMQPLMWKTARSYFKCCEQANNFQDCKEIWLKECEAGTVIEITTHGQQLMLKYLLVRHKSTANTIYINNSSKSIYLCKSQLVSQWTCHENVCLCLFGIS